MQKETQIKAMRRLVRSGKLNEHQREVLERLIFETERGNEREVAAYLHTMESAATLWAANFANILNAF